MSPQRIEELAEQAVTADAIRTAVREALDAAAAECEVGQEFGETRLEAFNHGRDWSAARIRRLRDQLTGPTP